MLVAAVALVIVGPKKLPTMLGTLGRWMHKLRRLSTEVRQQTGIDEILREEGLQGGLNELRGLMRGSSIAGVAGGARTPARPVLDLTREYPPEGADAYGALADDLVPPTIARPEVPPAEPPDAPRSDSSELQQDPTTTLGSSVTPGSRPA